MSSQFNDNDDDTPLYTRRAGAADGLQSDGRADEMTQTRPAEREVTLNTGVVLGLFFALALLCAVFFGFGYSIGHKSVPPAIAADPDPTPAEILAKSGSKPAPGFPAPAPQPVPEYVPSNAGDRTPTPPRSATPAASSVTRANDPLPTPGAVAAKPATGRTPAPVAPGPGDTLPPVAAAPGSSFVQIAAISHQEDADVLLSALRRRGYAVLTRSDPADKLIHVQVGPFGNRKEAEAMRLKLAADGYNAFIK